MLWGCPFYEFCKKKDECIDERDCEHIKLFCKSSRHEECEYFAREE